jgi:hypothetical protein
MFFKPVNINFMTASSFGKDWRWRAVGRETGVVTAFWFGTKAAFNNEFSCTMFYSQRGLLLRPLGRFELATPNKKW